ncbi:MAG: class II aldolase/adducin family protein [Myxococcota bacterium]|nr:class II aldolase/adducin family protein [Myxococcota bacterium]
MSREETLRRQIVEYAHRLHRRGWVANHDGNISAILSEDRLLCTPTAVSKGDIRPEMLIVVDPENKVVQGTRRAFSELQLHRAAYRARPEIGCVMHSHAPTATGFAVANQSLGHPFMAEPVVSLGTEIPMVPFYPPKDPALDRAIADGLSKADVLMLANHGVLTVGADLEQAFLRMELVEHLAKIALVAKQLGGAVPLSSDVVAKLSKRQRPSSSRDPSLKATPQKSPKSITSPDISKVVEEALRRNL